MIYLDNASTTFPKPPEVVEAVADFLKRYAVNPGRGNYAAAVASAKIMEDSRFRVASLFGVKNPARLAFTLNATDALNAAIKGFVRAGDRVVTTTLEHNAVVRPLRTLLDKGLIDVEFARHTSEGLIEPSAIEKALDKNTRLVAITHGSNVFGAVMDIEAVAEICRRRKVSLLVDASQTAGHVKIDAEKLGLDFLAFSGHKGLYGPTGTGCLYVRAGLEISPWREGGAGEGMAQAKSEELKMPLFIETGTQNTVGIAGLGAAVQFVSDNFDEIESRAAKLTRIIMEGLIAIKDVEVLGPRDLSRKLPVVSFVVRRDNFSARAMALALDEGYSIAVRGGEHCAPLAHKDFYESGTLRASPGFFNTPEHAEKFVYAVSELLR